jgi:hypothetical protein
MGASSASLYRLNWKVICMFSSAESRLRSPGFLPAQHYAVSSVMFASFSRKGTGSRMLCFTFIRVLTPTSYYSQKLFVLTFNKKKFACFPVIQ